MSGLERLSVHRRRWIERWTALFRAKRASEPVENAATGISRPVPLPDILHSLHRLERDSGRASLTDVERWIVDGHGIARYALTKGGFEQYFAVISDPQIWNDAGAALCAMKREGAAAILRQAIRLYTSHDHDDDDLSETQRYLAEMAKLDFSFHELMRSFEAQLCSLADRYHRSPDSQLVWKARLTPNGNHQG